MENAALKVSGLTFRYGADAVLKDINITVQEHSFLVIIGPNGGGKSTFLKLIVGLLKSQEGTINIFGKDVHSALDMIGYVPQDSSSMMHFPIHATDVVKMGFYRPSAIKYSKKEINERAVEALDTFGMADYRFKRMNELSGGQRQRVYLARAIACQPKLLVLDEPVSGIDPAGQSIVLRKLKELSKSITVIFVSHDLSVIPDYATSVACVNRTLYYHPIGEITPELLTYTYGELAGLVLVSHGENGNKRDCGCNHD